MALEADDPSFNNVQSYLKVLYLMYTKNIPFYMMEFSTRLLLSGQSVLQDTPG